jgi:hypothetical protein
MAATWEHPYVHGCATFFHYIYTYDGQVAPNESISAIGRLFACERFLPVCDFTTTVAVTFLEPAAITLPSRARRAHIVGPTTFNIDAQPCTEHWVQPDAIPTPGSAYGGTSCWSTSVYGSQRMA